MVEVARTIGEHLSTYSIVMTKSTVPVGTSDRAREELSAQLRHRNVNIEFDMVSNPKFLKVGTAAAFMKPARVVAGTGNPRTMELLRALYEPFTRSRDRFVGMDVRSAELTKYAAIAMLATKINFMNEMANIAEKVRAGIGSDPRISFSFIYPGAGYGGSCFPKDLQALVRSANGTGYKARIREAVEAVSQEQKGFMFRKIRTHFQGDLAGRLVAVWGRIQARRG